MENIIYMRLDISACYVTRRKMSGAYVVTFWPQGEAADKLRSSLFKGCDWVDYDEDVCYTVYTGDTTKMEVLVSNCTEGDLLILVDDSFPEWHMKYKTSITDCPTGMTFKSLYNAITR